MRSQKTKIEMYLNGNLFLESSYEGDDAIHTATDTLLDFVNDKYFDGYYSYIDDNGVFVVILQFTNE